MKYNFKILELDTQIFGFKIAKIIEIDPHGNKNNLEARVNNLINQLKHEGVKYATYRFSTKLLKDFLFVHILEKNNFVFIDSILGLSLNLKDIDIQHIDFSIREADIKDIDRLRKIAGKVFRLNRFYWDPVLPHKKCHLIYEEWIKNSVLGKEADFVFVACEKNKPIGFITLQKDGHIPLLAIDSRFQGRGMSKNLLNAAFAQFKKWKVYEAKIETTFFNIPALRAYFKAGFNIIDSFLTFRWSDLK